MLLFETNLSATQKERDPMTNRTQSFVYWYCYCVQVILLEQGGWVSGHFCDGEEIGNEQS